MLVEGIGNTLYMLEFIVMSSMCFGMRHRMTGKKLIGLELALVALTCVEGYIEDVTLRLLLDLVYASVFLCVLYDENKILLTVYGVALTASLSMVNLVSGMVVAVIAGIELNTINPSSWYNIFELMVSLVFLLSVGMVVGRKLKKGFRTLGVPYIFLIFVLIIVESTVVAMLGGDAMEPDSSSIHKVLYILTVVIVFIQIGTVILLVLSRNVFRENERLVRRYLDSQVKHYSYLENKERETKKFRHDLRKHMRMLMTLCNEGKYDEVYQYLETMNGKIDAWKNEIYVGNGVADAILNQYYDLAKQKGIFLNVKGHFPVDCKVCAFDLCTILSNLLSNAVRAEEEWGGKEVLVQIGYTDTEILIRIENDYTDILKTKQGRLQTSKPDAENHGFGLENVEEYVNKNQGYMDIKTENGKFRIIISLYNEIDKEGAGRHEMQYENSDCG